MIFLISSGEYSDYRVGTIVEGPDDGEAKLREALELYNDEAEAYDAMRREKEKLLEAEYAAIHPQPICEYPFYKHKAYNAWYVANRKYIIEKIGPWDFKHKDVHERLPNDFKVLHFIEVHTD